MTSDIGLAPDVAHSLIARTPFFWINPNWQPLSQARPHSPLGTKDIEAAAARLERFGGLLAALFPELEASGGIIESKLLPVRHFQKAMAKDQTSAGRWFIKADHDLPVAGSIKARGGIYEVLVHAEELALRSGIMAADTDRRILAAPNARALFGRHAIAVGSTGNLGLSIGVMAAALGFQASVHMSSDAKPWKKERLRARGVTVVEHDGDFGAAVAAGRAAAGRDAHAYFVDDENSEHLFLGYAVAALRLQKQLAAAGVTVDAAHPLFVYLPCGVGGSPGGITFGLRHLLGDHVHCFFAEPVGAPCMLLALAANADRLPSVRDIGIDGRTEADGLAVGTASEFVVPLMRSLVSGIFTVTDDALFADLYRLEHTEGLRIEPSAAAGFPGPAWLQSEAGRQYLAAHTLPDAMPHATHILWTTGGVFLPEAEYRKFHDRGRRLSESRV